MSDPIRYLMSHHDEGQRAWLPDHAVEALQALASDPREWVPAPRQDRPGISFLTHEGLAERDPRSGLARITAKGRAVLSGELRS